MKSIFRDVEYPKDGKSIEHIIKEYDKVLEYKLYGDKTTKKQMYIAQFFCIVIIAYIFKCSWISLIIRAIYMMLLAICLIYNIILFRKDKKSEFKDKKLYYRFNISTYILICFFIYGGTFMYQTIVFTKWINKDYLICIGVIFIFSILCSIKTRIGAPKRFLKAFLYRNNKLAPANAIAIAVMQLLIVIVYFNKPTFILLITSYIVMVFCFSCIAPICFEYKQYDKIQKLKKEIGYILGKEEK